uniref:Fibronectin type-III domain-containing protein n=1 Tax=Poecilia mexicana TaxID=48701 RepID=A0A3B3Y5M7_9TELE
MYFFSCSIFKSCFFFCLFVFFYIHVGPGSLPPKPNIRNYSANQSLVVSWPRNRGASESDVYEIQISRTKSHTIIYNVSMEQDIPTTDSGWSTLTWISDLPLECVDHSVRIRSFCNRTAAGPWSNWVTNHGARAADKPLIFPSKRILKEGSSATLCCVPPVGVNVTRITLRQDSYPLLNIGDGVQAILMTNLTIPNTHIKRLFFKCVDSTGNSNSVENNISFPPQKPRNLNCTTSDMTNITCMWDPGRKRDEFDFNNQTHTLYIENTDQAPVRCQPPSCTFPAVPQQQEYNIRLEVKDQLGEETATYSFNISERGCSSFKLNESDSITLLLFYNNRCMHLCSEKTNLQSEDIYSGWNPICTGIWETMVVTLDLWRRIESKPDSGIRKVTLLWKPVSTSVKIQSYAVQWSQEGQTVTELKDSGQSQAVVLIGPSRCNFTVQAVLSTGSSISARIIIPPKDDLGDVEIPPVKKRLSRTADGFHLWWNEQTSVTCGHTVEWCIMGSKAPCTLQWMKVPKGNSTFLPAGYFKPELRYSFNIYGCTDHGDKLLEIQTGYFQEIIQPVKRTYASVTLEWHYDEDDPAQRAFITGYLVTVQEVQTDALLFNVSVGDPRQKSVTMEGLQQDQEYVCSVRALTTVGPGSAASITIRTKVNSELRSIQDFHENTIVTKINQLSLDVFGFPSSLNSDISLILSADFSHLPKIFIPILLLLGCTILLWPQRKM